MTSAMNRLSRSSGYLDIMSSASRCLVRILSVISLLLPQLRKDLSSLGQQDAPTSLFRCSVWLFYACMLSADLYMMISRIVKIYSGRLTYQEKSDGCLVMCAFSIPVDAICNALLLPNFQNGKNWVMFSALNSLVSSALLDLPPSHQFITWITQGITFTFLDFLQTHNSATCTSASALALSIAKHISTRGILLCTLGLVNSVVPVVIFLRQRSDVARYMNATDSSRDLFHSPLSSFGIDLNKAIFGPQILSTLSWINAKAFALSAMVKETTLAVSFYGSLMVFFTTWILSARQHQSMPDIPSDVVAFAFMVYFMLGRQMSRLDVIPAIQYIDKRLEHSKDVMEDLLPGFVVDALMSESKITLQENNGNGDDLTAAVVLESPSEVLEPPSEQLLEGGGAASPHSPPQVAVINDQLMFESSIQERIPKRTPPSFLLSPLHRVPSHMSFDSTMPTSPIVHRYRLLSGEASYSRDSQKSMSGFKQSQKHDCVTVFFSDLVGFSSWSHTCDPDLVMETLNDLFTRLDSIILDEMPGLYKIETVGDAYVVAANLIDKDEAHALTTVRFALRAQHEASQVFEPGTTKPLQMRIGLHSGPVTAGIVGKIRKRYCLFGDTVNMCARTETSCPPGSVQLTATTYRLLQDQSDLKEDLWADINFMDRGLVEVKGSDKPLHMYLASPMATPSDFILI